MSLKLVVVYNEIDDSKKLKTKIINIYSKYIAAPRDTSQIIGPIDERSAFELNSEIKYHAPDARTEIGFLVVEEKEQGVFEFTNVLGSAQETGLQGPSNLTNSIEYSIAKTTPIVAVEDISGDESKIYYF
ncbi:hypothetical protein NPA08_04080 [Mycoplasmopsis citelli]|uniref:hypothetical protein n=1 Tax=Mycoplasmopsis citelli TaxID=171281 RepID=UPI002115CB01|nr:hypothetical protein [Mycoplasmopsis citelli]UUD36103.1 hypothetical protein NPA08_04080 [Mycoplasmopsis citelli]